MNLEEPQLKILVKGAGFVFAGLIVSKILGYVYRLLVARLGPAEYGQLSLGLAIAGMLVTICLFGFPQTLMRYVPYYESRREQHKLRETIRFSMKFTFVLSTIAAIILFLMSDKIAVTVFNVPSLAIVFKLLAVAIPLDVIRNNIWAVTKAFRKVEYEVISRHLVENISKVALTALFLYAGFRLFGAIIAFFLAIVISFLISIYFLLKLFPANTHAPSTSIYRELLNYSAPLLLTNAIIPVIAWADTLMLGYFKSVSDVGIYNAASPTAQLMYFFPSMIYPLFGPVLATLYAKQDGKTFSAVYATVTKWILMANMVLLVLFMLLSSRLLGFLFGPEYSSGGMILAVLAIGYFIYLPSLTCNAVLLTFKRTKLTFVIFLIGGILNVALNWLLIPKYGITGAAAATATSLITMGCANFFFARFVTGMRQFKPSNLKIVFSATVSLVISYYVAKLLWNFSDMVFLPIIMMFILFVYLMMLLITKSFTETDVNILRAIQQKTGIKVPIINKFIRWFAR